MGDSMFDSRLRDLMEHDTIYLRRIDTESLTEMPSDSLSFSILIGCYPYLLGSFCILLEFCDSFFLFRRYLIFWDESTRNIDTKVFSRKITYMAK